MVEQKRMGQNKVVSLEFRNRQQGARIYLLGAMRATNSLGENLLPRGKKARAILGYLCLHAGQRIPRSRLASLLWDRVPDQQARSSLRQALRELSQALGPLAEELLVTDLETVKLEARTCWIDAKALTASEAMPEQVLREDLASICSRELLEDLSGVAAAFDQWLLAERTRFASQITQLLEEELDQLSQTDADPDQRAALARRVIAFDPTHEGASRILMRALADMGERGQALREYERCRSALKAALDVEPSPETRALYQALKAFSSSSGHSSGKTVWQHDRQFEAAQPTQDQAPASSRLQVGVLPFRGEGTARIESLALSISQELASALARFRWFDVIAPTLSHQQKPLDEGYKSPPQEKKWHYVVDGTLSGSHDKLQISIRLLDVDREARPVWNDRFELAGDVLDQAYERVVAPAVARMDPVLLFIEGQQRQAQRSGATSLVLQAIPLIYSLERTNYEQARRLIDKAMKADPSNAKAIAWGAFWHVWYAGQGWAQDAAENLAKAQELALRAVKLDPEDAEALGIYAHICAFLDKDFESAVHYFERALRLNPNLAFVWAMSAPTYCYIGQPERALKHLDRYHELTPFDPYFQFWEGAYTIAYTFKGDYEEAVKVGRRAIKANPAFSNDYKPFIAALGHLGRRDEAVPYVEKLLSLEPNFTVEQFGRAYPFQRDEDRQRYMRGLELAGVPLR